MWCKYLYMGWNMEKKLQGPFTIGCVRVARESLRLILICVLQMAIIFLRKLYISLVLVPCLHQMIMMVKWLIKILYSKTFKKWNLSFHICYEVETWTNGSPWQMETLDDVISLVSWLYVIYKPETIFR